MVRRAPPVATEAVAISNSTPTLARSTAQKRKAARKPKALDPESSRPTRKEGVSAPVKKPAIKRLTKKAPLPPPVDQGNLTRDPNETWPIRQVVAKKIIFGDHQEPGTRWKSEMDYVRKTTRVAKSHSHLLGFSGIREKVEGCLEILMDLMPGDICQLKATGRYGLEDIVETTCKSMLQALDYLVRNDIVHRDIRPENILYEEQGDGGFNLKLANFGLRIDMSSATHNAGINPYQAPEVLRCRAQTHAADMWSLFATLCTLAGLYEPSAYSDYRSAWTALYSSATLKPRPGQLDLRCLREAIIWHVKYRATAAQMLMKLYNSAGLASTGSVPELMAWDTWERLFGGREVTQHLYDGHIHALPAHIHSGTQPQRGAVGEIQVSDPNTGGITARAPTEHPTITPATTTYEQAPSASAPKAAQAPPPAALDAAAEAEMRSRIEQEMRQRIEAQMRETMEPQLRYTIAAETAAAREALETRLHAALAALDGTQAQVDEALAAQAAAEAQMHEAVAAREAAERQCGEALLAEQHEFLEAAKGGSARRASLRDAEVARGEVETRLRDALEARDASRAQMEDAVRARDAGEQQLVRAEVTACETEEKLKEVISKRDAVETQLRKVIQQRNEVEESMRTALQERDTMEARVEKAHAELNRVRLEAKTASLHEPKGVYIRGRSAVISEPQIIYVSTTTSCASEEPSRGSSVTYPMNPAMKEKSNQFNSVKLLVDHEREQLIANSLEGAFEHPGSLKSNWQAHFSDFLTGISNENRTNIFA